MKKIIIAALAAMAMLAISCEKDTNRANMAKAEGYLSFADLALEFDDAVDTKATAAGGGYFLFIYDSEGTLTKSITYADVKKAGNSITLPAGDYTLLARSREEEVPNSVFEQPVYGVSKDFSITAGQTTSIGSLTCTLLQCKVTVSYNDEFLKSVTGDGKASVTVTAGYPLEYDLSYSSTSVSYDQSAGYFAVGKSASTTMEVTFKGNIDGKSQKMTKVFSGINAKQWRQVKFIKKLDESGNASFDIQINSFVEDTDLNNVEQVDETIIGDDPDAPKGDGGINMVFDYAGGCDAQFTDLQALRIPTMAERTMKLKFKVNAPNGIKKFVVKITTTNDNFASAVEAAGATTLDLINPSEASMIVFDLVPFPHGSELIGMTEVNLDLSASQEAIVIFPGTHSFSMELTDMKGCKKVIPVAMIVE